MAKYNIQFHFKNGTNYQFVADVESHEEVEDILAEYQENHSRLIMTGDGTVPFLFNPDNVLVIVAVPAQEPTQEESDCSTGKCCSGGVCH